MTAREKAELLQGTLDVLVLKSLQRGPMHGWAITEWLDVRSENVLQVNQGSLYPALYRLERQGLVESAWRTTDNKRRARYYSLTKHGRRHLARELKKWTRLSHAVDRILEATR
ncbi:MAG TPA: PadR family transcriptional regulator [Vicinamibacteria bacterium]|jgi:transcriptional regulator